MKKQLFLASALALVTLASCGGSKGGVKVGLICLHDKNSTYDANFIQAFESACEKAKKEGRIADYSYVTDVGENDQCFDAAERFVKQGYSIIFSDSYGHDPYMKKAAEKYSSVFFSSATGDLAISAGLPNFHNAFASIYEGRYLAGVAAGKHLSKKYSTNEGTIHLGYVAAKPTPEVISGYNAWYLGVKSVVNNVDMKVKYTNEWYDYEAEANAATTLISEPNNCVMISQHADSMGAPSVCKERGIPNVSYNINTVEVDKTCEDTYVAHSSINWEPYYTNILNTAVGSPVKGETKQNWTGNLSSDSVKYNVSTKLFSEDEIKEISNIAEQLKTGAIHVFDTAAFTYSKDTKPEGVDIIKDNNKITSYKVDVDGDGNKEELIKTEGEKSWFDESSLRSAPLFAIEVDGITQI